MSSPPVSNFLRGTDVTWQCVTVYVVAYSETNEVLSDPPKSYVRSTVARRAARRGGREVGGVGRGCRAVRAALRGVYPWTSGRLTSVPACAAKSRTNKMGFNVTSGIRDVFLPVLGANAPQIQMWAPF